MATSKKKVAKKVVKKAKKNKFLGFLLFIVIIGVLVLGGLSYVKLNKVNKSLASVDEKFDAIPNEISSPVDFFSIDVSGASFSWVLDKTYFPTTEELKRPTYTEGNKTTTITLKCVVEMNAIDKILDNILKLGLDEKTWSKNVKILALEATDKEIVEEYASKISLPDVIYANVGLRTSTVMYDGVSLSWESRNPLIMTNEGVVTGTGECELVCTITKGSETVSRVLNITVASALSEYEIINTSFEDYNDSTYTNVDSFQGLELINSLSKDGYATFRVKKDTDDGIINTLSYENLKEIKFSYTYTGSSGGKDTYTKNSYVELLISDDQENYTSLKKETLSDALIHDFSFDLTGKSGYLQVKITTEYSESYIAITDFLLTRYYGASDVKEALLKDIPSKVNANYDFPLTTSLGGVVSYTSSNEEVLSNLGVIKEVSEPTVVTYHVTVSGFAFPVSFDVEIKVVGPSSVEPVEVRFIDLNKNGGNSDCGESTYIRIGNIDVLIDAGDNYNQTFENVKACINEYSLDKEIDYMIATHPDSDHIGGMDEILKEFSVLHLITFVENSGDTTGVFNSYKAAYTEEGCEVCYVTDSYNNNGTCKRRIELANDVYIDIINTTFYELDANATNDNNGRSIVCVLNAYGTKILFTGDAENLGRDIESATKDEIGNIDILKVVHHGTKNGCSLDYLRVVDPEVAIICNGNYLGNKHGHPTYEAISSLYGYDANMKVYTITGGKGGSEGECEKGSSYVCSGNKDNYDFERNGMITITIDDNGYNIVSENYGDSPIEIKDTKFYKEMADAYN